MIGDLIMVIWAIGMIALGIKTIVNGGILLILLGIMVAAMSTYEIWVKTVGTSRG